MVDDAIRRRADEVQERLRILWLKLEDEGHYVRANTVTLAQELIRDATGVGPKNWEKSVDAVDSAC
jgi:hypothetical protein